MTNGCGSRRWDKIPLGLGGETADYGWKSTQSGGTSLVGMTQDALEATHFLIDMDSTLVDSHRVVEWVWGEFAERHGLDRAEVLQRCIGVPAIETLRHYLDDEPLAQQEFRYILDQEEGARQGIVEIPGAAAFVAALNPGQWALVTSATGTLARIRLELAGIQAPQVCVFGEDVSRGKPDPEPYRRAAEGVGVDPATCIVLEDSPAGVRSGLAAGARVVVVGPMDHFDDRAPRIPDFRGITPAHVVELANTSR